MALFTVRPTRLDRQTAAFVAHHTDRAIERTAGTLTWGADEHVISVMARWAGGSIAAKRTRLPAVEATTSC